MLDLYVHPFCPYCRKVERVLDEPDLADTTHRVSVFECRRDGVREVSGQPEVPVLVDPEHGVEGMNEGDDIVAYLRETYGGAERPRATI